MRPFLTIWSPIASFGVGMVGFKNSFRSTHVIEPFLFSMSPSILTYYFYLIFGSFFYFWGPIGSFWGGLGFKTNSGSTQLVEQFLFSVFSSILSFDVDFNMGPFFTI